MNDRPPAPDARPLQQRLAGPRPRAIRLAGGILAKVISDHVDRSRTELESVTQVPGSDPDVVERAENALAFAEQLHADLKPVIRILQEHGRTGWL